MTRAQVAEDLDPRPDREARSLLHIQGIKLYPESALPDA